MEDCVLKTENLYAYFGEHCVLKDINICLPYNKVISIIGPSGCGKTTFIRCINRMHELAPNARVDGKVFIHNEDIYKLDPIVARRKTGMVFQKPNPFPTMSIYDNVIAGYKLNGIRINKEKANQIVEESLKRVALWDEVKDRLNKRGTFLSGGQQQRLCIARALAMNPEILLLDEPTSALDPITTSSIEELIIGLKDSITILIVTHNIEQAGRISDLTAFLYLGELIEFDTTRKMFTVPSCKITEEYLTRRIR